MNWVFYKFYKTKPLFTRHVQQRALQRIRLYLTKTEQADIRFFLERDFKTAKVDFSKHMSPFLVNKNDTIYGKNSFIASSKYFNYYGNYSESEDMLIIKTVVVKSRDQKPLRE